MPQYLFTTDEFALSETGIHLLRSRFNYQTIPLREIKSMRIAKGKETHNWWLVLIIGGVMVWLGMYLSIGTIKALLSGNATPRQAVLIYILLIPVSGAYFVYCALETGPLLQIECFNGDKRSFRLRQLLKEQKLDAFKEYLRTRSLINAI